MGRLHEQFSGFFGCLRTLAMNDAPSDYDGHGVELSSIEQQPDEFGVVASNEFWVSVEPLNLRMNRALCRFLTDHT